MTRLRAEGVVTGYAKVEILHGVSVEAGDGQVTCIFGPNGCGKSTLLRSIAGAIRTWQGNVTLDGDDITGLPSHDVLAHGLALMPQGGGVFKQLSVRDNLRMGGYTLRSGKLVDERIAEMLAIARALIVRPRFLLFDEPSAGLSPKLAAEALERVAALAERGVGVLMVEQNIREAMRVAQRIYVLVGGSNRWEGRPGDIGDDRELMRLYLGAPDQQASGQQEE